MKPGNYRHARQRLRRRTERRHPVTTWKAVLIAAIAALAPTMAGFGSWLQSHTNAGAMNGRLTQLLDTTKALAAADQKAADREDVLKKEIDALRNEHDMLLHNSTPRATIRATPRNP